MCLVVSKEQFNKGPQIANRNIAVIKVMKIEGRGPVTVYHPFKYIKGELYKEKEERLFKASNAPLWPTRKEVACKTYGQEGILHKKDELAFISYGFHSYSKIGWIKHDTSVGTFSYLFTIPKGAKYYQRGGMYVSDSIIFTGKRFVN